MGYNVQTAVDTKNHLIVTHEVTNVGSDRQQLKKMAEAAREALGTEKLTAIADRGYYNGEQIKACEDAGIVPLIPKSFTSNSRADGRYDKSDFVYVRQRDAYRCPAREYAIRRFTSIEHGMAIYKYCGSNDGNSFQLVISGSTGPTVDCTPLTEVRNGSTDYLFLGVFNHGFMSGSPNCSNQTCIMSFASSPPRSPSPRPQPRITILGASG